MYIHIVGNDVLSESCMFQIHVELGRLAHSRLNFKTLPAHSIDFFIT